jgi:uncharacterized protein YndB with AHSA1/START domain
MESNNKTQVVKDKQEKSILVSREFHAPVSIVWRAFSESKFLDQWWGPAPWHCETKFMNFTPGGFWLYAMISPEDERHWARMNYKTINPYKNFEAEDCFCDENGNINYDLPVSTGLVSFTERNDSTLVEFKGIYPKEADMQKIVDMGFEEGISICYDQLEKLLVTHKIHV